MGYRSTFITSFISTDVSFTFPQWFVDKWLQLNVGFLSGRCPIYSRAEGKTYGMFTGLEVDIQRAIQESKDSTWMNIIIVFMGEDGAVYRSEISASEIKAEYAHMWVKSDMPIT